MSSPTEKNGTELKQMVRAVFKKGLPAFLIIKHINENVINDFFHYILFKSH